MLSFLIFLPLIIFLFLNLFSVFCSRLSLLIGVFFCSVFLFGAACYNFFFFLDDVFLQIEYSYWFSLNSFHISWGFYCDRFIAIMLFVISVVSVLVIFYSVDYMFFDPALLKFLSYLFLFVFFMFLLVCNNNFLQLFFGWEGVGLCSFLLINFWSTRISAVRAGMKALLVNRIGDLFLLFAFSFVFFFFRTLNFSVLFVLVFYINNCFFFFFGYPFFITDIISVLLLVGAVGKSAQLGLHTWLPDAMEGPTPVSALIHAATMVTAGVFLILRCVFFFETSSGLLFFIFFWGGLTALVASTIGLVQNDIKKIIAYSTCSQLGLMFLVCGLSFYQVALFHLVMHAFFKALLFLVAGAVIHQFSDEQDLRKFGNFIFFFPFLFICCAIGSFSLMGLPFLAGFFSKDLIIESVFNYRYDLSVFFFFFICLVTGFSALYSIRLLLRVFFFSNMSSYVFFLQLHLNGFFILLSLFFLSMFSILSGYFFFVIFSISGNTFFSNIFFMNLNNINLDFDFYLPFYLKLLPIFFSIGGGLLIWLLLKKFTKRVGVFFSN